MLRKLLQRWVAHAYGALLVPKGESKYLALTLVNRQGGKLFTNFFLLMFLSREPMSQKEKNSKYL